MMETSNMSRSMDINWWDPESWKSKLPRSIRSTGSFEILDPSDIRNGWITLPDTEVCHSKSSLLNTRKI